MNLSDNFFKKVEKYLTKNKNGNMLIKIHSRKWGKYYGNSTC